MNEKRYICHDCGMEFTQGDCNYNDETAQLDFECLICGWQGTENEVEIIED